MKNRGFTLFEMIVVMGIITIIASLVLANNPGFNERLGVRQAAEDIAATVRQTQAYGLGVKEFGTGSGKFPGYGLYFQISTPTSYILFADNNGNGQYDAGEKVNDIPIGSAAQIIDLCANQKTLPGPCGLNNLTVIYLRPQPQVLLKGESVSGYSDLEIKIKGPRGTVRTIILWLSGQVGIE